MGIFDFTQMRAVHKSAAPPLTDPTQDPNAQKPGAPPSGPPLPPPPPPVAPTSGGIFDFNTNDPYSALHVNLGLVCILIGEIFAFQPREQKIGDISNLEQENTDAITAFSSMSSLMSYLLGKSKTESPAEMENDPQYIAARNTFIKQFKRMYQSYTPTSSTDPGNGNPKLSDIKFTVTIKEPDGSLKKVQIGADDPMFKKYWGSWAQSMGKYGNQIITGNGGTQVSGMQDYICKYLQTKLDSYGPIQLGKSGFSDMDEAKAQLAQMLNGQKSICPPDIGKTPSSGLQQIWGVFNSIPDTTGVPAGPGGDPAVPKQSMLAALMNPNKDDCVMGVDQNFSQWIAINVNSDSSGTDLTPGQKWVKDNTIKNALANWSGQVSDAETGVNTNSSLQTQNLQQNSSELNVIQQAIAQIVEQVGELVSTIVKGFLQG